MKIQYAPGGIFRPGVILCILLSGTVAVPERLWEKTGRQGREAIIMFAAMSGAMRGMRTELGCRPLRSTSLRELCYTSKDTGKTILLV